MKQEGLTIPVLDGTFLLPPPKIISLVRDYPSRVVQQRVTQYPSGVQLKVRKASDHHLS